MEYKWILIGIGILLIFLIVYKKRHFFINFFSKKKVKNDEDPSQNFLSPNTHPPPEPEQHQTQEEYIVLNIASSPQENQEIELGNLYIKLHDDIVPRTCENFRSLAKIEYKSCVFHRLIKGFMLQGGDYEKSNGTGGSSIFGPKFPDENFTLKHTKRGILSMANSGPNTNGSQFFITFGPTPHLDNKHVVFGEVVKGFDVLDIMENMPTRANDEPQQLLYIRNTRVTNRLD